MSIEKIRSELNGFSGKIYVYSKDKETGERFLKDAEEEGYTFGNGELPTNKEWSDLIVVETFKTIFYAGALGRIAVYSGSNSVVVVDYDKYIKGSHDYIRNREPYKYDKYIE